MNTRNRIAIAGDIILPDRILEQGLVLVEDGRIAAIQPAWQIPDGISRIHHTGKFIAPGFVDIHVHGAANADYMDGTADAVLTANRAHTRHGTTTIFPT